MLRAFVKDLSVSGPATIALPPRIREYRVKVDGDKP
jgi:hypothetical protein